MKKEPKLTKQTIGILLGRVCRVNGHDVWKHMIHDKLLKSKDMDIFFPLFLFFNIGQKP